MDVAPPAPTDRAALRWPSVAASIAVAAVVGWWAFAVLDPWVRSGRFPGAHTWIGLWPAVVVVATAIGLVAGIVRRAPLSTLVGGLSCGAMLALVAAELPHASSNAQLGDGPFLMPYYVATIAALALYVPAGPARHGAAQRLLLAAVVLCTANTAVFARQSGAPVALLVCLVALALSEIRHPRRAHLVYGSERLARAFAAVLLALVSWILVAALLGDSRDIGLRHWQAVLAGALLAHALAAGLDRRGAERLVHVLVLGVALVAAMALAADFDTARVEGWRRVLATRFRLFGLHPNQIGPFFAGGAVLCGALLLWRPRDHSPRAWARRIGLLVLTATCVWFLWRTSSRASQLGAAIGAALAALAIFVAPPRRPGRLVLIGAGLAALALAAWFTPLCDGLRLWLDAKTFEANSALGQRYHFWRMAAASAADNPFFGAGPGQNYMHARYAEPSYFDGARQTYHAHNLPLALAEGSGWPSLLLFLALIVGVLEFYRRVLRQRTRAERAFVAAPLAASLGMLTSNLLDLGQVQPTYLPLHLWITIGIGVAVARQAPIEGTGRGPRPLVGSVAAAALLGFGLLPLAADGLIHSGRLLVFTQGEPQRGYARLVMGRRLYPPHPDAYAYERNALARLGRADSSQLDVLRAVARREPGNARAWLDLAVRTVRTPHHEETKMAVERALNYDPRGIDVGETQIVRMVVAMREGHLDDAREALHLALVGQGKQWHLAPSYDVPVPSARHPRASRTIFSLRTLDAALVELTLDEGLERLGAEALAHAATDTPFARRHLAALHDGYMKQNRPEDALVWFQRYREIVSEPFPSVLKLEWVQLQALGLEEQADALLDMVDGNMRSIFEEDLMTTRILTRPAQANALGLDAIEQMLSPIEQRDLFNEVGMHVAKLELAMRIFLAHGAWDRALAMALRVMREFTENGPRRDTMEQLLTRFVDAKAPPSVVLELLAETIVEQNVEQLRDRQRASFTIGVAAHLHANWLPGDGNLARRARRLVAGTGPAGDALVAELERLERVDRGEQ